MQHQYNSATQPAPDFNRNLLAANFRFAQELGASKEQSAVLLRRVKASIRRRAAEPSAWHTGPTRAEWVQGRLERGEHMTSEEIGRALSPQARDADTFTVYLARTSERLEVKAKDWRDALRQTGRQDACIIERVGERSFEASFSPENPSIITARTRCGTDQDAFQFAIAQVAQAVDAEENTQEKQS